MSTRFPLVYKGSNHTSDHLRWANGTRIVDQFQHWKHLVLVTLSRSDTLLHDIGPGSKENKFHVLTIHNYLVSVTLVEICQYISRRRWCIFETFMCALYESPNSGLKRRKWLTEIRPVKVHIQCKVPKCNLTQVPKFWMVVFMVSQSVSSLALPFRSVFGQYKLQVLSVTKSQDHIS